MSLAATLAAIVLHFATPAHIAPLPVVCYPTQAAYFADTRIAPVKFWPGGAAGSWGWPNSGSGLEISLTPQECSNLAALSNGYTWQRGYSVLVLTHEIGHMVGGSDENAADCFAAGHAPAVAYLLGLRAPAAFAKLASDTTRLWDCS